MAGKGDGGGFGAGTGGQGWEMRQAGVWQTKVWASRGVGEGVERVEEQPRSARGRNRATLKASSFHTNEQHLHCLDLPEHRWKHRLNMNGTSKHLKGRFVGTRYWLKSVCLLQPLYSFKLYQLQRLQGTGAALSPENRRNILKRT